MNPETISYTIAGYDIELELDESVFRPTSTSQMLAEEVEIPAGSTVLDLGCGVGPLAIVAALRGAAHVHAVDVMPRACDFARANAIRNGVGDRVTVLAGDLFEPVQSHAFDVIIDDVSGMAEQVARVSPWFPDPVPTGGADGTDVVTRMLSEADRHLNDGGSLYFPVLSLSNAATILEQARGLFGDRLQCLRSARIPFCAELRENIANLEKLREQGSIDFTEQNNRFLWTLEIYRASKAG